MRERALSAEEQVLAQATKRDVQAAGGLEMCAGETGLSTSQLSRCGSTEHADSLTLRDAATIMAIGQPVRGAPFMLHALARLLGKIVIDGPGSVDGPESIQASVLLLVQELGDFSRSVGMATADGVWTLREVGATLADLDEHDAVSATARCKLMQIKRGLLA